MRNHQNSYFVRVGGLTTEELNELELEFVYLIGLKLHVNVRVFESNCCHLEREASIGGGYHVQKKSKAGRKKEAGTIRLLVLCCRLEWGVLPFCQFYLPIMLVGNSRVQRRKFSVFEMVKDLQNVGVM
ncbi:cyclin-P1-1-like [Alnus glutinosa]|uniref:cyclin-P1-1-like n=1 Tax=Alnus glutinosa TaxID=3517 RepID=UPI002D7662E5|nr:cyclin-P1-1-like [Alnus glutinosa]